MFNKLYQWMLNLAGHRLASYWLAFIGFIESIFFPIPADVLLAPMCLSRPEKAYRYAAILSFFSFEEFRQTFNQWGIPLVFAAGFSPFPYKIATIGSGLIPIAFPLFFLGSAISRPLRFFLIAWAIKKGGEKLEKTISKYIEWLGWLCIILVVIALIYLYIK